MATIDREVGGLIRPSWIGATIDRCQAAIGATLDEPRDRSVGRALLQAIPPPSTPLESVILRGLLAEILLRRAVQAHLLPADFADVLHENPLPSSPVVKAQRRSHPKAALAIAVMMERYADADLRLTDVARGIGATPWHLSRLLHADGRPGFVAILRKIRLEKGATLLLGTSQSTKQVAAAVGYKYASDFARHFRQRFGSTPSAWRRL